MAWQLIYTSSPRLLEAGRTGFGTVARHRAVSGMLTSSVERFSQFARLPGHDPRRVVHTYRILTVGSGTFHVFSCLQDAGSDYTGRTNHIAHHLIAEPREIRTLSATGQTPADVLLAMAWRTSWSEGPRFLDPAEEVDLSSLAVSNSRAWAAVTRNPAHARLLWTREALKGCYLIVPAGANTLELFREALQAGSGQAWQTSFTTCLEPNDDLADFRWVGLPPSSPLRGQVETSSRHVLDLTQPASLPVPPEPEIPATAPEAAMLASVPEPSLPMREPPKERLRSSKNQDGAPSTMGDWTPESRQKAANSGKGIIVISLVVAVMLIVTVAGGLLWQYKHQTQEREAYDKAIAKIWKDYGLSLTDTRRWLEDQTDIHEGTALLKTQEEFFQSMRSLLSRPGNPVKLSLPAEHQDDLGELTSLLEEWTALHANPWAKLKADKEMLNASVIQTEYRGWQTRRAATWKRLGEFIEERDIPPPEDQVIQPLRTEAHEVLARAEPERGSQPAWERLFAALELRNEKPGPEGRWLKLWAELEAAGAKADATAKQSSADKSLPEWLRNKAKKIKLAGEQEGKMAGEDKPGGAPKAEEPPKMNVVIEDADSMAAKSSIYIHLLQPNEDLAGKVTGLRVEPDMQLYVGEAWDAHPLPDGSTEAKNGELKKWAATSLDNPKEIKFGPKIIAQLTEMILFSDDGKLISIPEQNRRSSEGVRMVARSKDAARVLFDLRLIPISQISAKPVFTQTIKSTVSSLSTVTLRMPEGFLRRLHVVGQTTSGYSLRHDGAASEQKLYELKPTGDSAFEVLPPQAKTSSGLNRTAIEKRITELETSIQKDTEALQKIESSNSAKTVKEADQQRYKGYIAAKALELQTLQAQLQSMDEIPTPMNFTLPPGDYTLLYGQPNRIELCKLAVAAATKSSPSKPSNP